MRYVKDGNVYNISQIRFANPGLSIPESDDLSGLGYSVLVEVSRPQQEGYYAIESTPIDNIQQWELVPVGIEVPSSISPRQARLQLIALGKIALVDPTIDTLNEPEKSNAKVEWEYATRYDITHPFVVQMLSLLEIDINEFFIAAGKL